MDIVIVGIDLGNNSCSLARLAASRWVVLRRRMRRGSLESFVKKLGRCVVAMEACCGAHHLGRVFAAQGILSPIRKRAYHSVAQLESWNSNRRTEWRLERAGRRSFRSPAPRPLTQAFRSYVEQRNKENPEDGCSYHAAEHRRAHRLARDGPGPPRNYQGQ
jgi:hypothetical protein